MENRPHKNRPACAEPAQGVRPYPARKGAWLHDEPRHVGRRGFGALYIRLRRIRHRFEPCADPYAELRAIRYAHTIPECCAFAGSISGTNAATSSVADAIADDGRTDSVADDTPDVATYTSADDASSPHADIVSDIAANPSANGASNPLADYETNRNTPRRRLISYRDDRNDRRGVWRNAEGVRSLANHGVRP